MDLCSRICQTKMCLATMSPSMLPYPAALGRFLRSTSCRPTECYSRRRRLRRGKVASVSSLVASCPDLRPLTQRTAWREQLRIPRLLECHSLAIDRTLQLQRSLTHLQTMCGPARSNQANHGTLRCSFVRKLHGKRLTTRWIGDRQLLVVGSLSINVRWSDDLETEFCSDSDSSVSQACVF